MDEEEFQLLLQQLAAQQYGSGPDYMAAEENPYKRPQERLNYWQDIEQLIGVPLTQLAGVGEAPTDPAEAPNIFQSDVGAAYRSNPVFADAFDLIDQGVDPYKAMAAVQAAYDAGEYGDEGTMLVPQRLDELTGGVAGPDWEEVSGTIQQYATDQARTQRETDQYQLKNSPAYSSVQKDGARYANAPLGGNDPFAWANEADLYDWNAVQSDVNKMGNAYQQDIGPTTRNPDQNVSAMYAERNFDPLADLKEYSPAELSHIRNQTYVGGPSGGRMVKADDRKGRGAVDPIRQKAYDQNSAQRQGAKKRQVAGTNALNQSEGDAFKRSLQANVNNRRDRAGQTMVRSDANANAMARLKAAYALILGQ